MTETRAQKRIKNKNRKQETKKEKKPVTGPSGASDDATETEAKRTSPEGPEPEGLKERVKRGFLTEEEALLELGLRAMQSSDKLAAWLKRRKKNAGR
jgi:hypothetical protein